MILLADLLAATGGQVHGPVGSTTFESFCFDSRVIRPGQLFLAVKTERADGHDYIADACAAARPASSASTRLDDVRHLHRRAGHAPGDPGLGALHPGQAGGRGRRHHRQRRQDHDQGGDRGRAWARPFPVFKNRANYNGLYGLPIALGELRPEQRIAVLEMAADHFGEIGRLARIAPPHVAVVTTVEPAHLETFGSLEAIAREKGDLVAALSPAGLAVLNADDPRVLAHGGARATPGVRVMTFGTSDVTGDLRPPVGDRHGRSDAARSSMPRTSSSPVRA